jgi:modulator of FtsH protease
MLAADIYRPAEWHDFLLMVGGAAAVLTGLVFVALSLNLDVLLRDPLHRSRSIGTLTNFGAIFLMSAVALMGDPSHVAIGIVWVLVSIAGGFVYDHPWPTTRRASPSTLTTVRFITGSVLYLGLVGGSVLLLAGAIAGLYPAASSMILLAVYSVTGAWLLVVGARDVVGEASSGEPAAET